MKRYDVEGVEAPALRKESARVAPPSPLLREKRTVAEGSML